MSPNTDSEAQPVKRNNSSSSVWHRRALRYGLAFMAVGAGFGLRVALTLWVGPGLPTYITFYPAVMVAALLAGFGPGLLATALAGLSVAYWVLPPEGFAIASPVERLGLALFAGMGLFMSAVAEFYRRDRRKAAAYDKEMALRESDERLRFALETSHTGAWDLDLADHTAFRSIEHDRIFGYAEALPKWTYEMFLEHVLPEDRAMVDGKFRHAMETRGDWNFECRIRRPDGQVRWIWAAGRHRLDAAGAARRMAGIVQDITERKQVEEALRESEERHQLATSVAKEAIWEVNLQTGTVRWNHAYAELFGRLAEAKDHGPWWLGRIHPEDRERVDASFTKVLAEGGNSWTCDYRMKLADDSYAFLNDRAIIVRDKAGAPLRAVGAKLNVTERKQAEEALASQRKELQVILESVPAMIFYKDKENHFVHTNKAFEDAMGLPKEKLHGQSLFDLYPKDMAEAFWNDDKEVMASRKSKYGIVEPMQTPHGTKILQTDKIPYFDESGNVVGVIGFAIDITERKRAEEALRESEARFRVIASNTPDHILVQDRDLRYATVINPQLGLKEEDMIGKTDHDFLSAPDADKLTQIKRQVLETGNPVRLEAPLISRTGEQQFFDGTYVPKYNAQGRIDGLIGYFRNVTERKRTEEALKFLVRCGTTNSGEGFFQEVARYLGLMLGMNFVCIDRLEEGLLTARTLAVYHNGRFEDNVFYTLKDTPCGDVVGQRICCFPRNVRGLFPKDAVLQDLQAESYLGTTLWNSQGKPIGLIAVIGCRPLTETRLAESILQLVAVRAAGELERQQADEALRKLNEELEQRVAERTVEVRGASLYARRLLEASLDPLVTISPEGKITDVNQATELVTGLPREQLIGSNFSDYFTEPQKAEAGYQKVLAEGQVRDYPLTIRHVSGRTTDVLYNATVYRNEAGTVQGVFAAARDITERTEAERRRDFTNSLLALFAHKTSSKEYLDSAVDVIRRWSGCQALGIRIVDGNQEIPYEASAGFEPEFLKLENRLSIERDNCCCIRAITAAFESQDRALLTPAGSFRCDDSIAFHNQLPPEKRAQNRGNCAKFGFASVAIIPIWYRDEVIGAIHLADRRPGRFPPAVAEFIESMSPLIGEAVRRFQTEAELAKHRNQLEELVRQRTGELEAANLHLQKEIAQRADAETALRQSAQDLERSNRDLEQFAYVASHDLQEPLRAVGGYVKLLQHRFPDKLDAKVREYITGAADGAERMQKLITDLLAFSRVGARGGAFVLADLNGLLSDALNNLQVTITESGAKVTSDPLPSLPVDATQIVQLFQNLIGNAIKFRSEQAPEIHVGARKAEKERWLFWVRDNGIGIEPQYAGRIFQIFQRLHTRKQYPGTGIGLAICKKIVERHGGEIRVESQPAHGSTFYFSIPEISAKMEHSA
jgi:PAS domain S-box-containing protein